MSVSKAIEIIKAARKAKKLRQEEVASMIAKRLGQGYSRRQYQKLEAGEFPVYKDKIVTALEEILGIKIFALIYEDKAHESDRSDLYPKKQNNSIYRPGELTYVSAAVQNEYPARFQDLSFIQNLPQIYLPGIPYYGEQYRVFEVRKDATTRYQIGDFLICNKIELNPPVQVVNFDLYTVVRQADVIMGWLTTKKDEPETFIMQIPNTNFNRQIRLPLQDIKELWHAERTINIADSAIRRFNIEI